MEQFWYGKYLYTLSTGIKSFHPAKSTAASTAGGCWPTETKQTCRSAAAGAAFELEGKGKLWATLLSETSDEWSSSGISACLAGAVAGPQKS